MAIVWKQIQNSKCIRKNNVLVIRLKRKVIAEKFRTELKKVNEARFDQLVLITSILVGFFCKLIVKQYQLGF